MHECGHVTSAAADTHVVFREGGGDGEGDGDRPDEHESEVSDPPRAESVRLQRVHDGDVPARALVKTREIKLKLF